jgi:hypothetical protein
MPNEPQAGRVEEWATLFYLCGHYDRPEEQDPFVAAIDEIRRVGPTDGMSTAVFLDLESGAQRLALRSGESADVEFIGAVNSGDPQTLEQFLAWAFDACPARRYVLVMAGVGIMDAASVAGRQTFDADRMFAICDDRATDDAIELHELSATLKAAFPGDAPRRLVMLACDMYAMQFMEVAYELRGVPDLFVGIQGDQWHASNPVRHWPYAKLLQRWQAIVATPLDAPAPRWKTGVDARALPLATQTIALLAEHYGTPGDDPVTVSAINLPALTPLAQALDTFSVVFLQWLSNDVIWRARETVVSRHLELLQTAWSYDLAQVADTISDGRAGPMGSGGAASPVAPSPVARAAGARGVRARSDETAGRARRGPDAGGGYLRVPIDRRPARCGCPDAGRYGNPSAACGDPGRRSRALLRAARL